MLSLLSLTVAFQAQAPTGLDTPITYNEPAKAIGALLADLTKQANVPLKVNAEAGKEVVLVSVSNLPLKSLLDKIAFVTSCEWKQSGDGYTLVPAASVRQKEENQEAAFRLEQAKKTLQDKVQELQKAEAAKAKAGQNKGDDSGGDTSEAPGAVGFPGLGGPEDDKTIVALLEQVDPSILAQIQGESRAVWATNNATQVQIPLGGDSGSVIQNWIAQHNAGLGKGEAPDMEAIVGTALPKMITDMIKAKTTPVTQPISKAILVAQPLPFLGGIQVSLKAFNADGKVLLSGQTMLGSTFNFANFGKGKDEKPADAQAAAPTPIEYSASSKEMMSIGFGPAKGGAKLSADLKSKMLHPETYDPLSFVPTDMYLAVAKHRHRQLVADLPDSSFGSSDLMEIGQTSTTVEQVEQAITKHDVVQATDDGQYLYLRPAKPAQERLHRADRTGMRTLFKATETKLMPGLDDIADFAVTNDDPIQNALLRTYLGEFCPGVGSGMMMTGMGGGWSLYRIFGNLDGIQRQTLRSGGSIPFASMSGGQQSLCAAYLYGSESNITADGDAQSTDMISRMVMRFMGSGSDYRDEPTEIMPNGLPAGGSLSCNAQAEPFIYSGDSSSFPGNMTLGPEELAMFRMWSKASKEAGGAMQLPKQGLIGSRLKLDLFFHVAPKLSSMGELMDPYVDKNAQASSLATLPADFESKIAAQMQALQKSPMGSFLQFLPGKEIANP